MSSPYVNRDIYLLDNRNHAGRTRDAKRRTYTLFLNWLEAQQGLNAFPWAPAGSAERSAQRQQFIAHANGMVPAFKVAYVEAMMRHDRLKRVKRYFNGATISALTGFSGKELGECMRRIRDSFHSESAFEAFFEVASETEAAEVALKIAKAARV